MTLLAADGLHYSYEPGSPVLEGADLVVESGTRTALLGPNGGGKTTLMRLLVGSLAPSTGTVRLDGVVVGTRRRDLTALRRAVQLVLQDPADQLFATTAYQDVSFGPVNLGLPEDEVRARVAEALAALEVAELADRPTHLLSFGQQKRVALAGAVAMRPRLLLLDEPTAGLDPAGVDALLETLAGLEAGGTTLVLSTHDVDLAWRWADRVAVVVGGRVQAGPAQDLLTDADVLAHARLRSPWGPQVSRLLGRDVRTAEELARALADVPRDPP